MNISTNFFIAQPVILILFLALCSVSCTKNGDSLNEQKQIEEIVEQISLIKALPPKQGEPLGDKHALAIVSLGKKASPYLVKKITDTTPTPIFYLFQYKVGDIALVLLHEIYHPSSWPSPEGSLTIPQRYGDYRDYVDFVSTLEGRTQLKKSWEDFLKISN